MAAYMKAACVWGVSFCVCLLFSVGVYISLVQFALEHTVLGERYERLHSATNVDIGVLVYGAWHFVYCSVIDWHAR